MIKERIKEHLPYVVAFIICIAFLASAIIAELGIKTWWGNLIMVVGVAPIFILFIGIFTGGVGLLIETLRDS